MFDRGSIWWRGGIVGHGDRQIRKSWPVGTEARFSRRSKRVELLLPPVSAQNEKLARAGIAAGTPSWLPPMGDGRAGKGGRVVGDTQGREAPRFRVMS